MNKIGVMKPDNTGQEAVKMRWDHKELLCLVFNLALQGYSKKGLNVFSDGGIAGICRSLPEVINFKG